MKVYLPILAAMALAACGDDEGGGGKDTQTPDTTADTSPDTTADTSPDAASDTTGDTGPAPYEPPTPIALAFSATTPDQLQAVAAAGDGVFYAVGFIAEGLEGSARKEVIVVRLTADGLDTTFGEGGLIEVGLDFRGGNDELDIAVDGQGRIVIAGVVANAAVPADTDIAVARLLATGELDAEFALGGVRVLDLNAAIIDGTTVTGGDRSRGLAVDASDRIYVHAVRLAEGDFEGAPRTDTDFSVVRLTESGDLDASFADGGEFLLDIRGAAPALIPSNATPRGLAVLEDGSVIAGGYATTDGLGTAPQAVLFKLDGDGALMPAFDFDGYFHDIVLSTQTEVYGFAIHGDQLVTAGYGREAGDQNDWVSLRFDVVTGERDATWGGVDNGAVLIDPSGELIGDNCRGAVALPEGKTLLYGSSGPGNQVTQDAAIAVLDADGRLDASYGSGLALWAFGGGEGGNDQLWGGAAGDGVVILTGYRGGGAAADQSADLNDDAYMIVLPIR